MENTNWNWDERCVWFVKALPIATAVLLLLVFLPSARVAALGSATLIWWGSGLVILISGLPTYDLKIPDNRHPLLEKMWWSGRNKCGSPARRLMLGLTIFVVGCLFGLACLYALKVPASYLEGLFVGLMLAAVAYLTVDALIFRRTKWRL